jgi:tetratricopeptide (TPR) repeat protein
VIFLVWKVEGLIVSERAIFTGLLVGYFVNNLFVFDNITSYLLFFSIAAFVHAIGGKHIRRITLVETEVSDMTSSRLVMPAVIIGCTIILYFSVWQGVQTSLRLIDGLRYIGGYGVAQDITKAIESFKLATTYGPLGRTETRERIVESVQNVNNSSADIPTKQAFLDFGKAELIDELSKTKDDARIEFFSSIFYANYGLYDDAIAHAKRAVELSPTKQTLLYHAGSLSLKKGNTAEAVAFFKKAYEEKPENEEALKYYALGLIYSGDMKQAQSLLLGKYGTMLIPEDRFAGAYMDTKNWELAAKIWEDKIKQSAGDSRYFYQLAITYVELGERAAAISTLQKIIALDPKLKDQVEGFIKQVQAGQKLQ